MVYLFHFELPVEEATWTSLATAYWPYLKSLTVSEVDACAAAVMHLSRACGAAAPRLHPSGGGDECGEEGGSGTVCNGGDDYQSDITFLNFFYVNTKKGIIARRPSSVRLIQFVYLSVCLFQHTRHTSTHDYMNTSLTWETFIPQFRFWFIS